MITIPEDLGYLAARVHGRHGRMAEGPQLEAACSLRSLEALGRAVFPEAEPSSASEFQRRVALGWLEEMEELARGLHRPRARVLQAIASRIEVEDQKVLVRALSGGVPAGSLQRHLLRPLALQARSSPASVEDLEAPPAVPRSFALEMALDHRYFRDLIDAMDGLDRQERSGTGALLRHEVDHFHLMLVVRGRLFHHLEASALLPLHVAGTPLTREILSDMLSAPDLARAAGLAVGWALDALPPPDRLTAGLLDAMAWRRFERLARRAFREGEMSFAALAGYAALRRVEVMNLITICEGLRLNVSGDVIRSHLIAPVGAELARA